MGAYLSGEEDQQTCNATEDLLYKLPTAKLKLQEADTPLGEILTGEIMDNVPIKGTPVLQLPCNK